MGLRNLFGDNCVVQCGGGNKGGVLPENWEEMCLEFTGAKQMGQYYGMTEVTMITSKCSEGHYHVPPWVIAYVLDPQTGAVAPHEGVHTGRAGFFDLVPQTHWGGFATGDEITADWRPCPCGRTTVHLHPAIQRLSEKQGGDDKITCAAADDAHAAAIDFLLQA
jgi:phenylacetate-coenzyme A ligase PaaK-like adenylate-forming protein